MKKKNIPPPNVAKLARELRAARRTRSGRRRRPWAHVAAELARQGHGHWSPDAVAYAVDKLIGGDLGGPQGPSDRELAAITASFEEAWRAEFPGEPWPGLEAGRRRLLAKLPAPMGVRDAATGKAVDFEYYPPGTRPR